MISGKQSRKQWRQPARWVEKWSPTHVRLLLSCQPELGRPRHPVSVFPFPPAQEHDLLAFLVWTLAAASRLAQRTGTALAGGGRRAAAGAAAAAQRVRAVGVLQPLRLAAGATWAWASKAVPLPRAALAALLLACLLAPLAAFSAGRWVGSQAHAELPQWPTNLPDASSCTCAGPVAATFLPAPARGDTPAVPLAFSDAPQQAQQATAGPAGQLPEPAASSPELMGPQAADSASGNASMPPRPADGEPPNFAPLEAWLEAEAGGAPPAAAALRVTATRAWAAAASVVRDYWRAQAWVRALAGTGPTGCALGGSSGGSLAGVRRFAQWRFESQAHSRSHPLPLPLPQAVWSSPAPSWQAVHCAHGLAGAARCARASHDRGLVCCPPTHLQIAALPLACTCVDVLVCGPITFCAPCEVHCKHSMQVHATLCALTTYRSLHCWGV